MFLCLGRYEEALIDLNRGVELDPKDPYCNTALAWLLATGPVEMRTPERALAIANQELAGWHDQSKVLGAAHYRLGQYPEAKAALVSAVQHPEEDPPDFSGESLFFLAMTCHQLGEHEEARRWFAQAEEWMQQQAGPQDVHLRAIHQETSALLADESGPHEK